jgi:hypothetical protein
MKPAHSAKETGFAALNPSYASTKRSRGRYLQVGR